MNYLRLEQAHGEKIRWWFGMFQLPSFNFSKNTEIYAKSEYLRLESFAITNCGNA